MLSEASGVVFLAGFDPLSEEVVTDALDDGLRVGFLVCHPTDELLGGLGVGLTGEFLDHGAGFDHGVGIDGDGSDFSGVGIDSAWYLAVSADATGKAKADCRKRKGNGSLEKRFHKKRS